VSLPLIFFRRANTCPLPVNRITFQLLYGFAATDSQRQQLADWYQNSRLSAAKLEELREKARASKEPEPLRPWSKFTYQTLLFGEVIDVPSMVTNREIYEWKGRAPFYKLPWYTRQQADASFASAAYNAFQLLEVNVTDYCAKHKYSGHYDLALIWMMMSGRANETDFPPEMEDRRAAIAAVGDNLLPHYFAAGGWKEFDSVLANVVSGIKFMEDHRRAQATNAAAEVQDRGVETDV
jgi:hypothetical protein